jgi:hypothetical protein
MSFLDSVLTADGFGIFGFDQQTQWGIFSNGAQVVQAEAVHAFSFKQDWPISTYQTEEGGFQSFDKVELPFEPMVEFMTGGGDDAKRALLDSIAAIAGDLNLYDVVTPTAIYTSCNITHYDYDRKNERGVGLLKVMVHLMEVRVNATTQYGTATPITNAKQPGDNSKLNNGTAQAQDIPSNAPNIGSAAILPSGFH